MHGLWNPIYDGNYHGDLCKCRPRYGILDCNVCYDDGVRVLNRGLEGRKTFCHGLLVVAVGLGWLLGRGGQAEERG